MNYKLKVKKIKYIISNILKNQNHKSYSKIKTL